MTNLASMTARVCLLAASSLRIMRQIGRLLIVGAVSAAVGGCGPQTTTPSGPTVVKLWSGWTGKEGQAFQRLVDSYNTEQSRVWVDNLGGVNDDTKTIRAIVAGDPPDLAFLWNPANLGPLAYNGALTQLDSYMDTSRLKRRELTPAGLRVCQAQGKLYALPLLLDATALFWNMDAFRSAGLPPDRPPKDLDELLRYARSLSVRDEKGRTVRLGLMAPSINAVLAAFGAQLWDDRNNLPTADAPVNIAAFRYYGRLLEALGGADRVTAFESGYGQTQGENNPFFTGKAAMMISGEWIPGWIPKYAPHLQGRYRVAPIPSAKSQPEIRMATVVGGNPCVIPAGSRHKREAWDFLVWLQRSVVQARFAEAINNVPNVTACQRIPSLTSGSEARINFGKFCRIAGSPDAFVFPNTPVSGIYQTELNEAKDFVIYGHKSPEKALSDAQVRVMRELRRSVRARQR